MAFLVGWVVVLLLLALWSSLVWSAEALLEAMLARAGTMSAGDWSLPESLTSWLPAWAAEWLAATVENLTPQLQALVGAMPWLSSGVTVLAWVVWVVGALVLLVFGVAIHVGVALWRKSKLSQTARPVPAGHS